jgi:hypothetical protein
VKIALTATQNNEVNTAVVTLRTAQSMTDEDGRELL